MARWRIASAALVVCSGADVARAQSGGEPKPDAAGDAGAKPGDRNTGERARDEKGLVERVLDAQGLSELSLERLLDLPVVTASGKAEGRALAAANVFIITRDDIDRHGYRSLGEMLRRVPGLYLVYDYMNYSVGVREVTGGYRGATRIVKIMIDGFPISFRPDLEAFLGPEFIPIEAIERVEIAKGPLSALYGANAFLATVNIITREPEERRAEVGGRYIVMNGNAGGGASALVTYAGIDSSLLLTVSSEQTDRSGAQARRTYQFQDLKTPALRIPSQDDLARPTSAFGRFEYHNDRAGDFRLEAGHQQLDAKAEFLLNSVVTHRSRVDVINQWVALDWRHKIHDFSLRAYAGGSRGAPTSDYQLFVTGDPNQSFKPRFGYRAFNSLAEASYDFGPALQADVGIDGELGREDVLRYMQVFYDESGHHAFDENELITPDAARSYDYRQLGTYLQLRSAPIPALPDFRLTAAARADFIDFGPVGYPPQSSFRGAMAYRLSPLLAVKLIGGRAFQTPSGTLLFAHAGFGNSENVIGTERLDNPRQLSPQVVTSAELVASTQLGDFVSLEGSLFYQDLDDAIRFNQAGQLIVAKNSGHVVTGGAELIANLRLGRLHPYGALSTSHQFSAELTRDLASITSFSGSPSMYPRLFGYAGFDLDVIPRRLFLNLELFFASARGPSQANYYHNDSHVYSLPGYHTLDFTLSTANLPLLDPEFGTRFLLSARNLFAARYDEPGFAGVDIPQPATTLVFHIRQTL